MAETKIAKIGIEIVHHDTSPINEYQVKRSDSRAAPSRSAVTPRIETGTAPHGRRELCTLSSAQPLVRIYFIRIEVS